jgi:hypothetical protein
MTALDMVIYIFHNTSWKMFVVLWTIYTKVENQFIKGFKCLRTDWWGKYTLGLFNEIYVKSMELFVIFLWHELQG